MNRQVIGKFAGVALLLLLADRLPTRGEEPAELADVSLQQDRIRLAWQNGLNRYIVERFTLDGRDSAAVATSSGRVDQAVAVESPDAAYAFYRVRQGVQALPLADAGLATQLRAALAGAKIAPTNWLYDADVNALGRIDAALRGIRSLTGLDGFLALAAIDLGGNRLASLLEAGAVEGLQTLRADGNRLADLQGLAQATDLHVLDVSHNAIEDLSPLAGLHALEALYLDHNAVSSAASLASLVNLRILDLSENRLTSIAPLIVNAQQGGLGTGDVVYLSGNPLLDAGEVATLRGFGATVIFP